MRRWIYPAIAQLFALGLQVSGWVSQDITIIAWGAALILTAYLAITSEQVARLLFNALGLKSKMAIIYTMAAIGALLGAVVFGTAAWFHFRNLEISSITAFSWTWDRLPATQADELVARLRMERPQEVLISSTSLAGAGLATSIDQAFDRARWRHFLSAGASTPRLGVVEGILISPDHSDAMALKNIIEAETGLPVTVRNRNDIAHDSIVRLVVGVKPIPAPLAPELRDQTRQLGIQLRALSEEIRTFATDRTREEGLLPARETYGPEGTGEWHERRVSFQKHTESLYEQKFGSRATPYLTQLNAMGIELPWTLRHVPNPPKLGKWFSVVGDKLEQEQIQEARMIAANDAYWFAQ